MKKLKVFLDAILAGIAISIGGVVFLACENKFMGACLFSVGLLSVCTLGLNLYTGRVCYSLDNPPAYLLECLLIWVGNLVGAVAAGALILCTRQGEALATAARALADVKLGDDLISIFILSMGCNMLIYLAVENYKNNPHEIGKYMAIFFGVVVFIMAGFEHCIANIFYFTVAGAWSLRTVGYLLVMTLGNTAGGLLIPAFRKLGNLKA